MRQVAALVLSLAAMVPSHGSRVTGRPLFVGDPRPATPELHDTHVSYTRMIVEGTTVACRIRLFKDDLEKALRLYSGQPGLTITEGARADSLFGAYAGKTLIIEADGKRVTLKVSASGTEKDPSAQEVVWYVLEGEAAAPPKQLGLLFGMMFEMFRDQQNLVQLLREPGGVRKTLYFAATEPTQQSLSF